MIQTARLEQTVQTQIRLDLGLHCLLFHHNILDTIKMIDR